MFFQVSKGEKIMTFQELYNIILRRKQEMPDMSYIASLFREGSDRIVQKIGEEATEVVIEAKNNNKQRVIEEISDLLFHTLILMVDKKITLIDIQREFSKRSPKK